MLDVSTELNELRTFFFDGQRIMGSQTPRHGTLMASGTTLHSACFDLEFEGGVASMIWDSNDGLEISHLQFD